MENSNLLSKEELRKNAIRKRERKNIIHPHEIEGYDMDSFIERIYDICEQNTRGSYFQKKLIYDLNGTLIPMNPRKDQADVLCGTKIIEVKILFTTKQLQFRFTNLRDYQKFDYFVFAVIDDSSNDFIKRYYCISKDDLFGVITGNKLQAMNGTTASNKHNINFAKAANVDKNTTIERLDKCNRLRGTEYTDLVDYLKYLNPHHETTPIVENIEPTQNVETKTIENITLPTAIANTPIGAPMTVPFTSENKKRTGGYKTPRIHFGFRIPGQMVPGVGFVNGTTIIEKTTAAAWIKFLDLIGIDNARKGLWPSLISPVETKWNKIPFQGHFISTRISARDMKKIFRNFKKNRLYYQCIEI